MTSFQLLRKRVSDDRRYKLRDLRTALDWTVWLYILIPALIVSVVYYQSWWFMAPEWLNFVPEQAMMVPLFLGATWWSLRVYLEEADQVYILQNQNLVDGLKKWGMVHSLLKGSVLTLFSIAVVLPFLITGWGWGMERVVITGFFVLLISWNVNVCRYFIELTIHSIWIKWVPLMMVNVVSIGILVFVSKVGWKSVWLVFVGVALLLALLTAQLYYRIKVEGTFFHDVMMERGYKQSVTSLLMNQVGVSSGRTVLVRKKPYLFRGSKRLRKQGSPETRIVDLYVKWLLRSPGKVQYYLQVTGWGIAAIFLLPLAVKVIVLLFALYAFIGLSKADWHEFSERSYAQLFQWDQQLRELSARKASKVFTMPCFILVCVMTGVAFPGWIGMLLFPLGGWVMMMGSIRMVHLDGRSSSYQ
ncbi:ABC transporter permease [Alkalihalobacillus macyae]|uniref:ABC transporter permease n=1 Tax=Guptibacillus hwajinpoensis TaxID=208199 RepID=UPI00273C4B97|nr:ABC transporter permease [Alkalihalobacillus macyae]MDP4551491.1 ABC transporter permease [Alkalihalobacillus macyae]